MPCGWKFSFFSGGYETRDPAKRNHYAHITHDIMQDIPGAIA